MTLRTFADAFEWSMLHADDTAAGKEEALDRLSAEERRLLYRFLVCFIGGGVGIVLSGMWIMWRALLWSLGHG